MREKMYAFIVIAILCATVQWNVTCAKKILIVASIAQYSHQITYRSLILELHRRGHEIVSITPNPIKNSSMTKYKEIDLSYLYKHLPEYAEVMPLQHAFFKLCLESYYTLMERTIWAVIHIMNRKVFEDSEVQKLYAADSGEHFDAVIVAQGPTTSLNAFAYRFNAPLIGISSMDVFNHMRHTFGSVILPSHISNWQIDSPLEENASFWKRLVNFYTTWNQIYHWTNVRAPMEDAIARKHLGNDIPYIDDITRNMSIYLVNRHPLLLLNRLEQRNVIFFHGFHIAKRPPALPENLKQFLDGAKDGFIYISFGSRINFKYLPNHVFAIFIEALSTLPYKILWKIDADLLPNKFDNIMASKWLSQQGILAHPNIKLFIYQGGLQSTEEAIYYGVPLIGYPILWDQMFQVRNIVRWGVGLHLQHRTISKKNIQEAVYEIITNKRYKSKMMQFSRRYKITPYNSLEYAAQWVEYVIRQNGTPFLRDSLCDTPWYQRYDWDIIGVLAVAAFVTSLISAYVLFRISYFCYRYYQMLRNNSQHHNTKSKMQ